MKKVADISHHNIISSWSLFSNQIDGVIIRIGHGVNGIDRKYDENVCFADAYDVPLGIYIYSDNANKNINDAKKEVDRLISEWINLKDIHPAFVAFDEELDDVKSEQVLEIAKYMLNIIAKQEKCSGFDITPVWYTGMNHFQKLYNHELQSFLTKNFELWIARYNTTAPKIFSTMWQYTNNSALAGTENATDLSMISEAAFRSLFLRGGYKSGLDQQKCCPFCSRNGE